MIYLLAFILFLLILLPNRLWAHFLQKGRVSFSQSPLYPLSWRFYDFMDQLDQLEMSMESGLTLEVPTRQYRFYTTIVQQLVRFHLEFGAHAHRSLNKLKSMAYKNYHYDLQFNEIILSTNVQMFLMFLMIWGMIFFSESIVSGFAPRPHFDAVKGMILGIHLVGVICFQFGKKKLLKRYFGTYDMLFKMVIEFQSLFMVGVSNNELINSFVSGADYWTTAAQKRIFKKYLKAIEKQQTLGMDIQEDLERNQSDLWHHYELDLAKLKKKMEFFKFSCLVAFFLSSYFLYFIFSFQKILVE